MEQLSMYIREAGWGIWPVLAFGGGALALAVLYALSPRRSRYPLVVGFSVATVLSGLLGTLTGVQNSVRYISRVEDGERWLFLVGLRESLNNLVLAFVVVTVACLLVTIGAYRAGRRVEQREDEPAPQEAY